MTGVWNARSLGDVSKIVGRGITPKYSENGDITVLNQRCIRDGRLDFSAARKHSTGLRKVPTEKLLREGDVLVNSTGVGTLGRTAWVPATMSYTTVDSHVTIVRPDESTDPRWLSFALRLAEPFIEALAEGSTGQTELSRHHLAQLELATPPVAQQKAIAEVLGALDDKIAANTKLVTTIDAMAHSMFRSVEAGSSLLPLSATAEFVNGKAFTKGASGTGRVVVRIAELNSGIGGSTVYSDAEVEDKHVARAGDILFAWSGSLTLHRWFRDDAIVNQHIFKVIPNAAYPGWLVFEMLRAKLSDFKSIAADKATTMGHIRRHHLDEKVPVPASDDIAQIAAVMDGLWQRGLAAERESLKLAAIRDALLPELMSGRLRVKDAEKKVGEVV